MPSDERRLRLLSLDGGGIRGLSIIYILKDVMRRVNLDRAKDLEPWEYFDMIGGTSTGGIIAIMLGRLKMTLDECERAYLDLSKDIFTPSKSNYPVIGRGIDIVKANGKFDATALENAIKKVIERHSTSSEEELLRSSEKELLSNPEPECKVFVCAIQSSKFDTTPVFLRTYKNDAVADLFSKKFKIWQACRATSAASTFFDPFVLQDGSITSHFLDGGVMLNNPVNSVFLEAQEVWGRDRLMSLISVGTGDAPSGQFHGSLKNVVNGLAKIATDSRNAAEQFYSAHLGHPQLTRNYFRLNVSGMGWIGLEEHELCGEIEQATGYYLQSGETKTKLENCVEVLLRTEKQDQSAQLNDADLKNIKEFTKGLYQRSFKYGNINRVPQHSRNTCEWFLEHPNFVQWQQSTEASALWVTADAGCGKSVLARFLVGHLADGHKVIHFFFQHFRYDRNNLLCALLHQLLTHVIDSSEAKSSAMLQILRDELEYKNGEDVMDEDEKLWNIICHATTGADLSPTKLVCIIDGLDECEEQSRSQFIELIVSTFSSSEVARQPHQPPNFLITSRPYPVIEERFQPLSHIRLRLEDQTSAISQDIETMIIDRIQNLNPKRFPSESRQDLRAKITRKAGRTFLWVKLIFDALEQLDSTTTKEIHNLLDTNPSQLNTLYESSLSTKNKEKTRRLLQILIAATRPLHLNEVNVALQISEDCMCFEDIELEPDVEGVIKRLCGSVLRIANSTVDFLHQTAREFLTSSRTALEPSQNLTWGASIDLSQAHCVIGSACLRYLALTDWNEKPVRWTGEKFDIGHFGYQHRGWARRHGRLHNTIGQSDDTYPVDSAPYTREEFDKIRAEVNKSSCFYQYAGRNWPHHSEEGLRRPRNAHAPRSEPNQDFCKLHELLTSLRESNMSRIRRCTSTSDDPFHFLEKEGFQFVFDWLSSGSQYKSYMRELIVKALISWLYSWKPSHWTSLFNYKALFSRRSRAHDIFYNLFRENVTEICSKAISQYRFDQDDQDAEQMEILEHHLRHLHSFTFEDYCRIFSQAIRWRHPSVDCLMGSKVSFTDDFYEGEFHYISHEMFSVACRYGSPTASLLFEYSNLVDNSAIDVNRADVFGVTPLIAGILANDHSLCAWLLRKKANANVCVSYRSQVNSTQWPATILYLETHDELLPQSPTFPLSRNWKWANCYPSIPKVSQRYGESDFKSCALYEAFRVQDPRIVELLLEYGGDPWRDYENGPSLFEAAALDSENHFDKVVDCIRAKMKDRFDINGTEIHSGRTLLHIAARHGLWNSVFKLISEGSSINVRDEKGWTPLHQIALLPPTAGRTETFKKLLEDYHVNPNKTSDGLEAPLELLEMSISNSDLLNQDQDSIQTWAFLEKLGSEPGYLPSVRRTVAMLERSQKDTFYPDVSDSEEDFDLGNWSD